MTTIKLAEALLRRKELQNKVAQLGPIKDTALVQVKTRRQPAGEGVDDVIAQVPVIGAQTLTHAFDWHAKQLRLIDAVIQRANWETDVEVQDSAMADYETPEATLAADAKIRGEHHMPALVK